MAHKIERCPICSNNALCEEGHYQPLNGIVKKVNCLRCGDFIIEQRTLIILPRYINENNKYIVSSQINNIVVESNMISADDIKRFSIYNIPSVDERAKILLIFISQRFPLIGDGFPLEDLSIVFNKNGLFDNVDINNPVFRFTMELMSRTWSKNEDELNYLLFEYLENTKEYIKKTKSNKIIITPNGWGKIERIKTQHKNSNIGFIAMKFDGELISYSKNYFETAITEAGYEPKVMYSHQHTKIIDNEMKSLIRKSKFVVCDLTMNSRGAYYEAGFAHGLGIPVLFLCENDFFHKRESELYNENDGVHFDTNHYPFILWSLADGEKLKNELKNWIQATIGFGLNINTLDE